jgi:hypothetical protein
LIDGDGSLIAKRRMNEIVDGVAELAAMLATAGHSAETPIPLAIETPRGLLVAVLRATGRPIYPINPLAVARYRARTSVSGKKSNHVDAMALANILRTDAHLHRMLPATRRRPGQSVCSRAPIKTVCGGAPSLFKNCVRGCASSIPASWLRSPPDPALDEGFPRPSWPAEMLARCWRSHPVPRTG